MKLPFFNRRKDEAEVRQFFNHINSTFASGIFDRGELNPTVDLAVSKICNTISTLQLKEYVHTRQGIREVYWTAESKLLDDPAVEETRVCFLKNLVRAILVKGRAYVYVQRDALGLPVYLQLCDPNTVTMTRDEDGRRWYNINGRRYSDTEIIQFNYSAEGYNGSFGRSPLEVHADVIKANDVLEQYCNLYFKKGCGSKLLIQLGDDFKFSKDSLSRMTIALNQWYHEFVSGAENVGNPIIAPPNSTISTLELPNNAEAELSQLLHKSEVRIASLFNIPASVLWEQDSKYNSLEQASIDFLQSTIRPITEDIAQTLQKYLIPSDSNMFFKWDYDDLIELDLTQKLDRVVKSVNNGIMTLGEARYKMNLPQIEDEVVSNTLLIPVNLLPATRENFEAFMASQKAKLSEGVSDTPTSVNSMTKKIDNGVMMDKLK